MTGHALAVLLMATLALRRLQLRFAANLNPATPQGR